MTLEQYETKKDDKVTDCPHAHFINAQSPLFCDIKHGYCNPDLCIVYQYYLDKKNMEE